MFRGPSDDLVPSMMTDVLSNVPPPPNGQWYGPLNFKPGLKRDPKTIIIVRGPSNDGSTFAIQMSSLTVMIVGRMRTWGPLMIEQPIR